MSDKTRKKISNLFFVLAAVSGLIALFMQIMDIGFSVQRVAFTFGIEIFAILGLLFRLKDILKWRGKMLMQGIQEAKAEKYCSKCGKALNKDDTFCSGCGSKIEN